MTSQKVFSTFLEQLELLQTKKQIIISDKMGALDTLQRIGYFPLISGYKHLFRVPLTQKYKLGTTFDELVALYEFDIQLKEVFFKYLLVIERHLRSLMSYYFSELYGESQTAYLDINNYNCSHRNQHTVTRLVSTLRHAVATTDYPYINYYRTTYGNIPLWVLCNILTFGSLSKMYCVFPQTLQSKICKHFSIINKHQMGQFLSVLTKFRNVCAHGERLFSYRTRDNISDLPLHKELSIPKHGIQYLYGKNDLFAVVIAFHYLISSKEFHLFQQQLSLCIANTIPSLIHINSKELLNCMGFPTNWTNLS